MSNESLSYQEAKDLLIQAWGTLGSNWGINKTMAQIHALLLISPESLSTEEIMEDLKISRGNANINTRGLIDWGLVHKVLKPGDRKEYFTAEKDMWETTRQIARERRRRELEPIIKVLGRVQQVSEQSNAETAELARVTKELSFLVKKADSFLNMISDFNQGRFLNFLLRLKR